MRVPMQMNDFPMVDVLRARALPGHKLWFRFTDASEGTYDLAEMVAAGGEMVEPLKAPEYFARIFVELGAPTWPNGFDLDPIALHDRMAAAGELSGEAAE